MIAQATGELTGLAQAIARRVGRFLQLQGPLKRDAEKRYLAGAGRGSGAAGSPLSHSIA